MLPRVSETCEADPLFRPAPFLLQLFSWRGHHTYRLRRRVVGHVCFTHFDTCPPPTPTPMKAAIGKGIHLLIAFAHPPIGQKLQAMCFTTHANKNTVYTGSPHQKQPLKAKGLQITTDPLPSSMIIPLILGVAGGVRTKRGR